MNRMPDKERIRVCKCDACYNWQYLFRYVMFDKWLVALLSLSVVLYTYIGLVWNNGRTFASQHFFKNCLNFVNKLGSVSNDNEEKSYDFQRRAVNHYVNHSH